MKEALHSKILNFLKEKRGQWIRKADIERFGLSCGYNATNAVRRIQEMAQPGHRNYNPNIEKLEKEGYVNYRYVESETKPFISMRAEEFLIKFPTKQTIKEVNTLF